MGMFLGKITVETPKFTVVEKGPDYEVREYSSWVVAETSYDPSKVKGGRDGGFMLLASYIGAFGKAANFKPGQEEGGEKIAMTAPVITSDSSDSGEKIAMTAPVITSGGDSSGERMTTMRFVLPSSFTLESVPKPADSRVIVKEMPGRKMGVITFSGNATDSLTREKLGLLQAALKSAGYRVTGRHMLARYNDPFTPWFLRTNEVMVPVEKESNS